jgi:hypothetical protein
MSIDSYIKKLYLDVNELAMKWVKSTYYRLLPIPTTCSRLITYRPLYVEARAFDREEIIHCLNASSATLIISMCENQSPAGMHIGSASYANYYAKHKFSYVILHKLLDPLAMQILRTSNSSIVININFHRSSCMCKKIQY